MCIPEVHDADEHFTAYIAQRADGNHMIEIRSNMRKTVQLFPGFSGASAVWQGRICHVSQLASTLLDQTGAAGRTATANLSTFIGIQLEVSHVYTLSSFSRDLPDPIPEPVTKKRNPAFL